MTPGLIERFRAIAEAQGITPEDLVTALELGKMRIVPCKLYAVILTKACCQWLSDNGYKCFIRGKNYYAISPDDAFEQFKAEFPMINDSLMVNIYEV